jgi:hypothetical protein
VERFAPTIRKLLAQRGTPAVRASFDGPVGLNEPASSATLPFAFAGILP